MQPSSDTKASALWRLRAPKLLGAARGRRATVAAVARSKNGTACSSASACASGFCVDGVCCENACDGTCVSCNQAGRAGKCSVYAQGSDPQRTECTFGLGACHATCNGAGACDYPRAGTPCGNGCQSCDGNGMCVDAPDASSCAAGGAGGAGGTVGRGGLVDFGGAATGGQGRRQVGRAARRRAVRVGKGAQVALAATARVGTTGAGGAGGRTADRWTQTRCWRQGLSPARRGQPRWRQPFFSRPTRSQHR
jgi:hypothetical protein